MKALKLLFVGNSFAVDTMEYAAQIAHSLGIPSVKFGVLFVGGCSIDMHYTHAVEDLAVYTYYLNEGEGWTAVHEHKISDAVKSDDWDWIAIRTLLSTEPERKTFAKQINRAKHKAIGGCTRNVSECRGTNGSIMRWIRHCCPDSLSGQGSKQKQRGVEQ